MIWTAAGVKGELVQAYRVLASTPGGSAGGGGSLWPNYYYEEDEVKEQERAKTTENPRPRIRYGPREIQRMELVLLGGKDEPGWVPRFLAGQPGPARCLVRYAEWSAQDRNLKQACRAKGWAYSTFRRKRDQAAQMLADALNAYGVQLP